jgi:hypothetical protein
VLLGLRAQHFCRYGAGFFSAFAEAACKPGGLLVMRSNWSKVAVLALASCMSVVACGDDDDSAGNTGGSSGHAGSSGGSSAGSSNGGKGGSTAGSSNGGKGGSTAGSSNAGTANAGEGGIGSSGGPATGAGGADAGAAGTGTGTEGGAGVGGAPEVNGAGGEGGYANGCDIEKSYGALGSPEGTAIESVNTPGIIYSAQLNSTGVPDHLQIELYDDYGVFSGDVVKPGEYDLTGDELNYSTCGACVIIYEQDNGGFSYRGAYMATGGKLTITQVSPNLIGTLTDATFEHVTIDVGSNESTPVGDECNTAISSVSFDAEVQ